MVLETAQRVLTRRNIKWLLTRLENHFESKQICFYSNLGKVFQLPEFQAKLFFKRNLSLEILLKHILRKMKKVYNNTVADPDLDSLALLVFFPSVISSFLPKIRGGGGGAGPLP